MTLRTKAGLEILQVAVGLGILGDVLLRQTPWGLNVLTFNLAFAGGMLFLLRRHVPERLTALTFALLGALVFFASMFVWRDSIELRVADTFAIITILGVIFLPTLKISASLGGVFQYAIGVIWAGINSVFAPLALLASDIRWNEMQISGWRKHLMSIVRGVLIATPLLLIFGALFMAADAVYEGWIQATFNIDFEKFISHGLLFSLFAWLTAGYFRGALFGGIVGVQAETRPVGRVSDFKASASNDTESSPMANVRAESGEHPVVLPDSKTVVEHINSESVTQAETRATEIGSDVQAETRAVASVPLDQNDATKKTWSWANIDNSIVPGFTLGAVEVGVIFGLVNLLFLSFVIFQVPYLFGGMELVQNSPDFTLAEYARRGFGELVAVSAIVLPMLLAAHWLLRKESRPAENLFRALAGIQIALLFVIMTSATQRLVLLTGPLGYGLTTVRLYPMIFMIWLAIVFILFGATVLRGARNHFAWAALWSAFIILGATHVLNPDAFIVRTNIALMQKGRDFDADYNSNDMNDDAIPALLEAMPQMSQEDRCEVGSAIHYRYRELGQETDIRSANWSRRNAFWLLRENDGLLHQTEGCPSQFHNDKNADGSEVHH